MMNDEISRKIEKKPFGGLSERLKIWMVGQEIYFTFAEQVSGGSS